LADPTRQLRENQQRLDDLSLELTRRLQQRLRRERDALAHAAGRLNALSPLAVLDRGYSIVHKVPEETIVKDSGSVNEADSIRITFAQGQAWCRVERKE